MVCRWLRDTTLTFVNSAYCRLFGKSREELLGRKWVDLVPESQRAAVQDYYRSLPAKPKTITYTHDVRAADGSHRSVEWVDSPVFDKDGKLAEFQSAGRDVTEKKELERQLAQVSEFERDKIRRDLHDGICQQLSGMALLAESLKQNLKDGSKSNADLAGEIAEVALDTANLAREMARGLVPRIPDYPAFVAKVEDMAFRIGKVYRMACRVKAAPDLPISDPDVLSQLFLIAQEAAVNAARHSRAKAISLSIGGGKTHPRLTVSDNGVGFKPESGTTGMGLDIMHSRARLIGWRLEFRPGKPGGTVVECTAGTGP
jgi:PAS domain S-box-containing protein